MIHGNILSTTVLVFFPGKRGGFSTKFHPGRPRREVQHLTHIQVTIFDR